MATMPPKWSPGPVPASGARHFDTPEDLAEQMLAFIETRNQTATPFHWTYTGKVLGA